MVETNNLRIVASEDVLSPQEVKDRAWRPDESTTQHILQSRDTIARIMNGDNKRMLVVTWPCSIHTEESAYAYAEVVKEAQKFENLVIVMRAYFEKPRTTIWWKWLINDPHLDDSFDINHWLILARQIYMKLAEMRIPIWIEQLDTLSPQYLSDLVSWSAIGARTAESQPHRELSSGLSSPVWIKNGTSWDLEIAINAMKAASKPHHFLSIGEEWTIKRFTTSWNPDTHIILRWWWDDEQNYELSHQQETAALLRDAWFDERRIIVDASHKNAPGWHLDQITVVNYMISQILAWKNLARWLMLEGHIQEWRQDIKNGKNNPLKSITDPCIWKDDTLDQLDRLNDTVGQMTS
jgi:3-deoxy-7-phosphoheptulonate synthase